MKVGGGSIHALAREGQGGWWVECGMVGDGAYMTHPDARVYMTHSLARVAQGGWWVEGGMVGGGALWR